LNLAWDTEEETREPSENPVPHSINAVRNPSDRRLPAVENLNKAVKITSKSSVKYGCNEKWNCPPVALRDAPGLDIGRDQELSFEKIYPLIKTQGLQLRRWKPRDPFYEAF
jgi:hypothetical protein